jgi:hypothetical protein
VQQIDNKVNKTAEYSLRELTEILVRHQNINEGFYNLSFEFQISVGAVGPTPETLCPGAMIGVSRIGIVRSDKQNIHTVDAAELKQKPKARAKKTK